MPEREWYDNALLLLLVALFVIEALLIARDGRLGRAMLIKCIGLAVLFLYGIGLPYVSWVRDSPWLGTAARIVAAIGAVAAIVEMLRSRWPLWRSRIPR